MGALDYSSLSLSNFQTPGTVESPAFPDYQYAADNHNYGNGNFAITDPTTWGEGLTNAGRFIVSSAVSGAASVYNSGVVVANWLGADAEEKKAGAILADLDSDLGKYYVENKESTDLVGFIASSFIPGTAGVKILNAGQKALKVASETGLIGSNLSKVTGLLTPATEKYTLLAANEIAQSSATFSAINANTLKAIRSGVGQAALESAAFETAVAATMFRSPLLEEQDIGDIVKNAAIGVGLGSVIGGALSSAQIYGKIKSRVKEADLLEKPYTHITEIPGLTPADRIIQRFDDLEHTPGAPTSGDFVAKFTRLRTEKENKLNNLIREDVHEMTAGKDKELANQIADSIRGLDATQIASNFLHATEIGRISSTLAAEKELAQFAKRTEKSGSAKIIEESGTAGNTKQIAFIKLLGEDLGNTYFEAPKVLTLADTFKNADEVIGAVKGYGFKDKKLWSVLDSDSHLETEARYIWADRYAKLENGARIHEHDIPLLEKALALKLDNIQVVDRNGFEYSIRNLDDLFKHTQVSKQETAWELLQGKKAGTGISTDEIAKRVNVRRSYLEGEHSTDITTDLFARQYFQKQYTDSMIEKGLWSAEKGLIDTAAKPTWFKAAYDIQPIQDMNGFILEGMAHIKAKYNIHQQAVDSVVAKHAGDYFEQLYHPDEALLLKANRYGAGPGLFSFANGNYHSLESWTEHIGSVTGRFRQSLKDGTRVELEAAAYKLAQKQEAAIEFQAINEKIAGTAERYVLSDDGTRLVARSIKQFQEETAAGKKNLSPPKLQEGAPEEIPILNAETAEAIALRIKVKGERTTGFKELRAVQGMTDEKDATTFYPIRPNPKDYPHFAFVVDPAVSGVGHMKMIHAATPKELESMIEKVPGNYQVIKKSESEEFHRAMGDYNYERTLHENYIDADMRRAGINSQFFVKTNPQKIATDWVESHLRDDDVFARELVNSKFEKEFSELRRMGEQYTSIASSKYGGSFRYAENVTQNPYLNYVKTALDISQLSEHPMLYSLNTILDSAFSRAAGVISTAFGSAKNVGDLEIVNKELQKYGIKTAYYDAATELLANHSAPKGALTGFVRGANSILATLVLRLDPLNAINNVVGHNVLLGSETKAVIRSILRSDTAAAGELGTLLKIGIPEIKGEIAAPSKLIANSMQRFFSEEGKELSAFYKQNGWITDISDQYRKMLDELTLRGSENVSVLQKKLSDAFGFAKTLAQKGETLTGNKLGEEFNRFVAADVMKQISDVGIKYGVITEKEQLSYINTFVNRTQGNIQASQRPLMFQGAIGQAIGLFQTYQFNLMQQLFRHVSEGRGKDAAMMLGLQSTIYGMNGLPAFSAINTHILGTMSGNPNHVDAYSATYGAAGKQMGDLLLYGIPSNLLRANLYVRGDINPRQATILPTNPADVPFVNALVKTWANTKDTLEKIGVGGNVWETLLQGIEHNGLSRPLAGIAQSAQALGNDGVVYSTSTKGNILGANDFMSWATISRIAGGKPLDEGIVNDATFRITAYQAADRAKKERLAEAIKSTVIGKQEPSQDQVEKFAGSYAELGGKQREFNKWMLKMITDANTSQANKIMQHLNTPYSQNMQYIMGGRTLADGNDF